MLSSSMYYGPSPLVNYPSVSKNDRGEDNSFTICQVSPDFPFRANKTARLSGFEIIWLVKGAGYLVVDGNPHLLTDQLFYFLAPGQWRRMEMDADSEYCLLNFSSGFVSGGANELRELRCLQDYYGSSVALPVSLIDKGVLKELEELMRKMIEEYETYHLRRGEILRGILQLFLLYFSTHLDCGHKSYIASKDKDLVKRFLDLVKANYKTLKMVADYANELFISPNYLTDVVKRTTGIPASHHIQQCVINEAKNQALYTNLNMKEIAYSLGYSDLAHFSKFFRNSVGMNFTTFKKKAREEK